MRKLTLLLALTLLTFTSCDSEPITVDCDCAEYSLRATAVCTVTDVYFDYIQPSELGCEFDGEWITQDVIVICK